jgi:hypothetical protein
LKKLRVLRLAQPPLEVEEEDDDPFRERQWRNHNFAEQIMQYLVKKGSPIELLAFSPTRTLPSSLDLTYDAVGHKYPHYFYMRGQSTIQLPNNQTLEQVVAHPVRKSHIGRYLDSFKVLSDPKEWPGTPTWAR